MSVRRILATATLTTVVALSASSPALARGLRQQPARRPAARASVLESALAALGGLWSQVTAALTGDNGAGIDPNGITGMGGDNGPGIDPNGISTGDNGAGIDPNG
jgi:hypothetical protein